jgi:gentisate 1,2-dioxygenase
MHEETAELRLVNDQRAQLEKLYDEMRPQHLYPLWEVLSALVTPEPQTRAVPAKWAYNDVRGYLMRAGDLISAEQAERRVVILENPGMPGESAITPRLYAGLQLVLPGEIAPCHRHSQSALRFIMEGDGAYTAVDGEKAFMKQFDLILTPNWRWHDHGNPSNNPIIWLDGLDIPTIRAKFGRGLRPLKAGSVRHETPREPLFHYPYAEWSASLEALSSSEAPDPHIGHALEFLNPSNGGAVMPTISAHVRQLPAGFESRLRQSTESAVFTVIEGEGEVEIGEITYRLEPRDIVVVPSWAPTRWRADRKLVLFAYTDRVVQEKLCLYREHCS